MSRFVLALHISKVIVSFRVDRSQPRLENLTRLEVLVLLLHRTDKTEFQSEIKRELHA
jgi:hypothetical protein